MRAVSRNLFFILALTTVRFASAQPVVANNNFDFEFPAISPPSYFASGAGSIPGWMRLGADGDGWVARAGFSDSNGANFFAGHGNQFAILGGGQAGPATVSLTTNVTGLTAGQTYTLTFLIANEGEASSQSITVSFPSG